MKSSTIDLIAEVERNTVDALENGVVQKDEMREENRKLIRQRFEDGDISENEVLQMAISLSDKSTEAVINGVTRKKVTPQGSMYVYTEGLNLGDGRVVLAKNAGVEAERDNYDLFEENFQKQAQARDKRRATSVAVIGEIMSGRASNCLQAIENLLEQERKHAGI